MNWRRRNNHSLVQVGFVFLMAIMAYAVYNDVDAHAADPLLNSSRLCSLGRRLGTDLYLDLIEMIMRIQVPL